MKKTKYFFTLIWLLIGTSLFAQAKRDTIFIYDTIRVSVKRPTPPPTNFFDEPTATISQDSIIIDEQPKQLSTMSNFRNSANRFIRRIAVGTMAVVSSVAPSIAQNPPDTLSVQQSEQQQPAVIVEKQITVFDIVSEKTPKKEAPVYLSFAYPLGLYGTNSEDYVFNFAFSAITGAVGGINGIQVAGIYNQASGPMRGIQVAGIMNLTEAVTGIQVAGIINFAKNVKGIQTAGIYNQSGDMMGIQSAGIANVANNVEGVQAAGIFNAADSVIGMQSAGIANEAETVHGAQFAGIFNRAGKVRGLQIGLYNQAKTLSGAQIGLINKVDTIHNGISIGLLNLFKQDRFQELEVSTNTYHTTFLNYRLGGSALHTLFGVGSSFRSGHLELRFGFGNMTKLAGSLYLQSSLYAVNSSYYNRNVWLTYQDYWTTLSSGLVYYWGDKIGIKVIPNYNLWWNDRYWVIGSNGGKSSSGYRFSWGMSLDVGLSIKL